MDLAWSPSSPQCRSEAPRRQSLQNPWAPRAGPPEFRNPGLESRDAAGQPVCVWGRGLSCDMPVTSVCLTAQSAGAGRLSLPLCSSALVLGGREWAWARWAVLSPSLALSVRWGGVQAAAGSPFLASSHWASTCTPGKREAADVSLGQECREGQLEVQAVCGGHVSPQTCLPGSSNVICKAPHESGSPGGRVAFRRERPRSLSTYYVPGLGVCGGLPHPGLKA